MSKGDKPEAYTVGYGRPPKSTQFKKGRSGNPSGRPKRNPFTTAMIEMADKPLPDGFRRVLEAKGVASLLPENATVADGAAVALNATLITMGKGAVQAGALIMERVEGKMPRAVSGQLEPDHDRAGQGQRRAARDRE